MNLVTLNVAAEDNVIKLLMHVTIPFSDCLCHTFQVKSEVSKQSGAYPSGVLIALLFVENIKLDHKTLAVTNPLAYRSNV
jgi:hypothetical protein